MPEDKVPAISEFGIYYNTQRTYAFPAARSVCRPLHYGLCRTGLALHSEALPLGLLHIRSRCLRSNAAGRHSGCAAGRLRYGHRQRTISVTLRRQVRTSSRFSTPDLRTELLNSSLSQDYTLSNNVNSISVLASRDEEHNYSIAIENADPTNAREIQIELPETVENAVIKAQRLEIQWSGG